MLSKMKTVTLVAAFFILGTTGFLIKVPKTPTRLQTSPVGYVHLQKLILPLFENVCEDSTNPIIIRLAQEFTFDSSSELYLKPEVVTSLNMLKTKGILPKGTIFTDYDVDHIEQLRIIYEVLYFAKDFDTFLKAASWARQNINCGLFVRALYLAVINRRDTEKLSIPAPYELLPNYFIQKDMIVKASSLLSGEEVALADNVRDEGNSYVLDANYTSDFVDNDYESKLAYFHEDIGLNTYYFLQKLKRSPWFNTSPVTNIQYGEYLYHMMKQLAARYNLERYANNLPVFCDIDITVISAPSYDPMLIYSNGDDFGHRTTSLEISDTETVSFLRTIESNVATALIHMRDTGYNKTEILNHLLGILVTGERSFETLLRTSLGNDISSSNSQPSVLNHYLTSLRDPIFWVINQKIVDVVEDALKELPAYSRNELYFPGVEIQNVDIKKVTTSFDYFQFDVTDALKVNTDAAFQVKIGQPRLSHKPFVIKFNVSSLVAQKGLIKTFLGPKIAPGELISNKKRFMLLDSFEYNFKMGGNVISRSSDDIESLSGDFTSLRAFRKYIEDSEFGVNVVPMKTAESVLGFPQRLILPKGRPEGLPLQLFVIIAPFVKPTFSGAFSIPNLEFNTAVLSPGYPLDLAMDDVQLLNLPNIFVKDIIITHKGDKITNYDGSGTTKQWSKGEYDPTSKSLYDFTGRKSYEPPSDTYYPNTNSQQYDFTAKKEQYVRKEGGSFGKKPDFSPIRNYSKSQTNKNMKNENTTNDVKIHQNSENETSTKTNSDNKDNGEPTKLYTDTKNEDKISINDDLDVEDTDYSPIYVRKPTVYDYIINSGDYYDQFDNKVYE